jgi:hypothetical protein
MYTPAHPLTYLTSHTDDFKEKWTNIANKFHTQNSDETEGLRPAEYTLYNL